jgi:hypothetical protein
MCWTERGLRLPELHQLDPRLSSTSPRGRGLTAATDLRLQATRATERSAVVPGQTWCQSEREVRRNPSALPELLSHDGKAGQPSAPSASTRTSTSEDLRAFMACGRQQDPPRGPAETARTRPARHAPCSSREARHLRRAVADRHLGDAATSESLCVMGRPPPPGGARGSGDLGQSERAFSPGPHVVRLRRQLTNHSRTNR